MKLSPNLYRKLRTNDPPTSEEAAAVRMTMSGSLDKLQIVEQETARLQSRLAVLCREKKDLHAFVEGHKGLLSPVRRLVPEILQEIFYHCLPTAHNSVLSTKQSPLLLGQVCSQWRQIAYSTPKLWSSLHIVIPLYSRANARLEAISAWLSRSGVLPLSISMSTSGYWGCGCGRRTVTINGRVQPYIDLIASHAHRWKSIYLRLPYFDWTDFLVQTNASDLPLLEVLHIEGDRPRRRDPSTLDISAPSKENGIVFAPLLRILSLPTYSPRLLEMHLHWRQLAGLNLGNRSLPLWDVARILELCPNLEACAISVITPDPQNTPTPQPSKMNQVALPKLRTLKVISRSTWNDNTFVLFDNLYTPALRHLAYERAAYLWRDPSYSESAEALQLFNSLRAFLQRLTQPLEELDYSSNVPSTESMVDILSLVPGLKRLSLKDFGLSAVDAEDIPFSSKRLFNDRLLARFLPNEHRNRDGSYTSDDGGEEDFLSFTCLCPKLEVLYGVDVVLSERLLLEFLRSRSVDYHKHNVAHLRRVSLSFSSHTLSKSENRGSANMVTQIDRLEKETGLLVDLQYPPVLTYFPHLHPFNKYSPYDGLPTTGASPSGSNPGYIKFIF